jgi:hypothetical protein
MVAAWMRQRYKVERSSEINEEEEESGQVRKIKNRGYGSGR